MKRLFLLYFCFSYLLASGQEKIHLEGKLVDTENRPVADAYVINYRNQDKSVSRSNGIFDIWVFPGDSLIISHISYYRKVVTVHALLVNPIVHIVADTVNILDINVSPEYKNDYARARENLSFIGELDVPKFEKIKRETNPTQELFVANNKVMRTEASSLTFTRFSPSAKIGKVIKKMKKRRESRRYTKKKYSKKMKRLP